MASAFQQWEKDPFFFAAEEVQESADRMESVYRRWIHEKKGIELRREVYIALGTTKWQLEELERAVRKDDEKVKASEVTVTRHNDFVEAISSKIGMVEKSLKELDLEEEEEKGLIWARMDKGEMDELALFLSCSCLVDVEEKDRKKMDGETSVGLKNPPGFSLGEKDHDRIASGSAEIDVLVDYVSTAESSLRLSEASSKPKRWYRNGFRKLKDLSVEDMEESLPLRNHDSSRGVNACYERSKRCLVDCADESYHKHHHDWFGAFHRQLQRSQYQIQYGRPVQMMIWITITVLVLFLFVLRAS